MRQWLGTGGAFLGASGRVFAYSFAAVAVLVAVTNVLNVITIQHGAPDHSLLVPSISEGSSWLSLLLFLWVPWLAWRFAPPQVRPRWKHLLHVPAALSFCFLHVAGFDVMRMGAYGLIGRHYSFEAFSPALLYEMRKDIFAYILFIGLFSLVDHLLRPPPERAVGASTFDIRDGAKLTRVRLDEILAVSSAGNYVEFLLEDGRRLLMRAPLRKLESELGPQGFVRTHRSWLVNSNKVTTLKPEGSGDYTVELGQQSAPLSRRFPEALARLRGA